MADLRGVMLGMLVGRVVAAEDLPARHAHAEMDPAAADLQALLAAGNRLRQLRDVNLVEVSADGHGYALSARYWWIVATAIAPSPTAPATRFVDP
jgi:hypothetical protein